jgi:hypothetical protein
MGWGLTIPDVYVSRATLASLDSDIEELTEDRARFREEVLMRIAAGLPAPTADIPDPICDAHTTAKQLLADYEEAVIRLYLLNYAKTESNTKDS